MQRVDVKVWLRAKGCAKSRVSIAANHWISHHLEITNIVFRSRTSILLRSAATNVQNCRENDILAATPTLGERWLGLRTSSVIGHRNEGGTSSSTSSFWDGLGMLVEWLACCMNCERN